MQTKVILLKDVPQLGKAHDVKSVSSGYVTNFLLPRGLVEVATDTKLANLELKKKQHQKEEEVQQKLLEKNLAALKNVSVRVTAKANEQGHLFQGIRGDDVVKALKKQAHIDLLPEHILLDEPLKEIGEHVIEIAVGEQKGSFKLAIETEKND